jgi:hypothetical protein
MAQIFDAKATVVLRIVLALAAAGGVGGIVLTYGWSRSASAWNVGKPAPQPIPFRHDLHGGTLKIDCRYCHSTAASAAFAGMPSAETCMSCHSQIWIGASVLEPVRWSLALDEPIEWKSVHRLPDHAYFHHGAHVSAGVGCKTCHGQVEKMTRTVKVHTLSMGWCLDCHRNPAPRLASSEIQPLDKAAAQRLTSCSTCHR